MTHWFMTKGDTVIDLDQIQYVRIIIDTNLYEVCVKYENEELFCIATFNSIEEARDYLSHVYSYLSYSDD